MQFVTDGPDIPNALLEAHDEGDVVFFCGAGVSYPAGLPSFEGLVANIYSRLHTEFKTIEREAFERKQYDTTLDLLEQRLPGGRFQLREALMQVLRPKLRRKGAVESQSALLHLARSREGALRLVTTNFDHTFHVAARRARQSFRTYAAPMLPIPKNSRWDGLVYLHGLLPDKADKTELNRLVVTSGDFGLAYLTERWAARFLSELFRNYIVCFVGYSINDPVLRYMMDALAADRMLGEVTPQVWALGQCEPGQESRQENEWKAKGVTPILYSVGKGSHNHSFLHQTLKSWAETYRDGVQGKEAIVVRYALARPQDSTKQDDFIGRMLWALADASGLPAKRFAELNPAPPLDWLLETFTERRFGHGDLSRFGIQAHANVNKELQFSLISRPSPYDLSPAMSLVADATSDGQWDSVMFHLARWLLRHLNDPRLVLWVAQRGGHLHDRWSFLIEDKISHFLRLEQDGEESELNVIRSEAPNAVPIPLMRTLWSLTLAGRVKASGQDLGLYRWIQRFKRQGMTAPLRFQLREILSPKVALSKKILWGMQETSTDEPRRLRQLVGW